MLEVLVGPAPLSALINGQLDDLASHEGYFDVIYCLGVDYLFSDLGGSFKQIHSLLSPTGMLILSRNVFIDMKSFFGGKPIKNLNHLLGANPLINAFFFEDHYRYFIQKSGFDITSREELRETYNVTDSSSCSTFIYIARKSSRSNNLEGSFDHETMKKRYLAFLKEKSRIFESV